MLLDDTTHALYSSIPIVTAETMKRAIKYLETPTEYVPWFQYHKKGGGNMGLYRVIFVHPKENNWEIMNVIAKSVTNAKMKAYKQSIFSNVDIDNLVMEVEEIITWDKEDYK